MTNLKILSGKTVSEAVYADLGSRIEALKKKSIIPGLAVILVGDDPASKVYVNSKAKKFDFLNLYSTTIRLSADIHQSELIEKIHLLNLDPKFHGILVQLPLPASIDTKSVLDEISPEKDVDGFHPDNLGRLTAGNPRFISCTPKGILRILRYYDIDLTGKHVVVIGRSNIVGRPISILTSLKQEFLNATTTICHSGTKSIRKYTKDADVVITAMGVPNFLDATYVKKGAVLIDVGINRVEDKENKRGYRLVGDVNFDHVQHVASALTPVPGGVGPMTIAMLVENTVEAAERASRSL